MATKKEIVEALAAHSILLDVATRRAGEQEAVAVARLAEVQQLQDEVVELQVALGDALDKVEQFRQMLIRDEERLRYLRLKVEASPLERLAEACRRFGIALRR